MKLICNDTFPIGTSFTETGSIPTTPDTESKAQSTEEPHHTAKTVPEEGIFIFSDHSIVHNNRIAIYKKI